MTALECCAGIVDRRRFVALSIGGTIVTPLAVMLTACASLATRMVTPVDGMLTLTLAQYPELSQPGGVLRLLPEGATEPIYVLVQDARHHVALSPICTHLGCTVDVQGGRLVCPCHGSTYDREGRVLRGPAERPLARYATQFTEDDRLVINLGVRK